MINFNYVIKEETKEHNPNLPQVSNHPYIILSSGSGKNALLDLISKQPDIDKVYLHAKDSFEKNINF